MLKSFVLAAVLTVAVVAMPGAPAFCTVAAFVALSVAAQLAYRRTRAFTPVGETILVVASALLGIGVIANVYYFTTVSGGTDASPVLHNPDALRNWTHATELLAGEAVTVPKHHGGIGYVYAGLMWLTGRSVTTILVASAACTMITLVCSAVLARRVGGSRRDATVAMGATASVCYLLAAGMIGIKDAWVIMLTALAACSLFVRKGHGANLPLFMFSVAMIAFLRANYALGIAFGVVFAAWMRGFGRKTLTDSVIALVMCGLCWVAVTALSYTPELSYVAKGNSISAYSPNQRAFFNIVGDYVAYPEYVKLLLLPVTAITQFLIPFPWNFGRDVVFGYSQIYAHIAFPWFFFGGVFVYWLVARMRRHSPRALVCLVLWGLMLWLVPCYTSQGTVSRYALPAVPLLAPAVASVLIQCRRRRSFVIWMSCYAGIMAVVLVICHHLQMSAQ